MYEEFLILKKKKKKKKDKVHHLLFNIFMQYTLDLFRQREI